MSTGILHFTLGPIQDFIFQARRTRDLWGGSFLLSWLSGIAMREVLRAGGCIVFPAVHDNEKNPTDELLATILDPIKASSGKKPPIIGSLPTRFKAIVPADFDPKTQIADVVRKTFTDAAKSVWERYVKDIEDCGRGTRAIWDRQINNFWEIAWVLGDDPGNGSDIHWLDARKNWRVPASTTPEGGDHCTVMHGWQELSGWVRARERDQQKKFWGALSEQRQVGKLDLRPDERLCAIAFVKRMLPKLARVDKNVFGWEIDSRNWPSTAYMAAVPWINEAWDSDKRGVGKLTALAYEYFDEGARGERDTHIACLNDVDKRFRGLDGNVFHLPALANENTTPLKYENGREKLESELKALQKKVGHTASPFYAILLMDGDSLGTMLHDHSETRVSASLAKFTHQVDDIVSQHNGVTVYAGGDDVLALLPLPDAINAACGLELCFRKAFIAHGILATLSAAIIYSHFKQPLQAVLLEARHQLDDVAKDGNGRSSLAIAVLQGAGKNIEWVSTWCANDGSPPLRVQALTSSSRFRDEKQFSTRFFYGLGNLFGLMPGDAERAGKGFDPGLSEDQMFRWMVAEYLDNREKKATVAEAEECVRELMSVCQWHRRVPNRFELQASGARLVKFLANPAEDA